MRTNKLILMMSVALITAAALLLTGSLALLTSVADEETPLPNDSGVPDISASETPVSAGSPADYVTVSETDGKKVARIFSEEQLAGIAERRENGEWLSLSMDEMLAIVNDTVSLFYDSDVIELGVWNDGAYRVQSYNGYLYYTSDAYTKQDSNVSPDVEKDVFEIILGRVLTLHDGIAFYDSSAMESSMPVYSIFAFADVPRMEQKALDFMIHGAGHHYDADGQGHTYGYLRFYTHSSRIELTEHTPEYVSEGGGLNGPSACHSNTVVFYDDKFAGDFVHTEEVAGSRRVRVEIFDESTQALVTTFTITDESVVNGIFDGFFASFDNACRYFAAFLASEEDMAYRGKYRVVAHMETTMENVTDSSIRDIDICYPYGYSNDVYGYLHEDLWMDYQIRGGSAFIELIDAYVDAYFGAE